MQSWVLRRVYDCPVPGKVQTPAGHYLGEMVGANGFEPDPPETLAGARVPVTGAGGFIGPKLCLRFAKQKQGHMESAE